MQAWGLQRYRKRDSSTGVFLWILQNFQEHLFRRTPQGDCFSIGYFFFSRKILDYPKIINSRKMTEQTLNYTWLKLTRAPGVGKYSPLQIWRICREGWLNEWFVMSLANNTSENTKYKFWPWPKLWSSLVFPNTFLEWGLYTEFVFSDTWTCFRPSNSKLIKSRKINYLVSHCFSKTTIFTILCYGIFADHDETIVLFFVLETESKIIILFYGKCWIKQNFTFWDGPPAKFGWIQVQTEKSYELWDHPWDDWWRGP